MKQPLDLVGAEQRSVTTLIIHHNRSETIADSRLCILQKTGYTFPKSGDTCGMQGLHSLLRFSLLTGVRELLDLGLKFVARLAVASIAAEGLVKSWTCTRHWNKWSFTSHMNLSVIDLPVNFL